METKRIKIVIVDDEPVLRAVLTQELCGEGYDAHAIYLKHDAYDWIIENKPDLIISDIKSPEMNGFEFLKLLKANPYTRNVPFIYVTGFADLSIAIKSKKMGASDFVAKPYDLVDLITTIERVLSIEWSENMYPPELSLETLADNDCIKFLSWQSIKELFQVTINKYFERCVITNEKDIWRSHFIFEYENKLYGGMFFRPIEYAVVNGNDVAKMINEVKSYGIDKGIMFSFFEPPKRINQYANLLGVNILSPKTTNKFLSKSNWDKEKSFYRNMFNNTRLDQLKISIEFLRFIELFKNGLSKLDGFSFSFYTWKYNTKHMTFSTDEKVYENKYSFKLVFVVKNYCDTKLNNDQYFYIYDIQLQEILAELWCEGVVSQNDLTQDEILNSCLFEILKHHPLCDERGQKIYLHAQNIKGH
jgi:CheY-like chemotaxis protein